MTDPVVTERLARLRDADVGARQVAICHPDFGQLYITWRERGFCLEKDPVGADDESALAKIIASSAALGYPAELATLADKATYRIVLARSESISCGVVARILAAAFGHGAATPYTIGDSAIDT
ncbi:MAG: hypothetical protein AAF513_08905 [Pseudomonadota bacterium]